MLLSKRASDIPMGLGGGMRVPLCRGSMLGYAGMLPAPPGGRLKKLGPDGGAIGWAPPICICICTHRHATRQLLPWPINISDTRGATQALFENREGLSNIHARSRGCVPAVAASPAARGLAQTPALHQAYAPVVGPRAACSGGHG